MSWLRRLYPALLAVFPVLGLAARNPGYYRGVEAAAISLVAIIAVFVTMAIVYAVLRLRLRHELAADLAAFAAFLFVALFYLYKPLPLGVAKHWARTYPVIAIAAALVIAGSALWAYRRGLHRRLPSLAAVGGYLSVVGAVLVGWCLAQLGYYRGTEIVAVHRSALVRELAQPVPLRAGGAHGPSRDVYIVLLDEYPSADVLREMFGIDNRPFEDSLRALGFRIPAGLRSNYANTLLSVSSLLNFAQLTSLADAVDPSSKDFGPADYLLDHNRAARFLKARGYRYVFLPSSWYGPTRASSEADVTIDPESHLDIGRSIQRSEFASELAFDTYFSRLLPYLPTKQEVRAEDGTRTLAQLAALPRGRHPTFAFAHLLLPHIPYMLDAACRPLPRGTPLLSDASPEGREQLAAELHCLNADLLRTVRTIIARSSTPPIIILQGDHGTQTLDIFKSDSTWPTQAQLEERFRPFGAYYLPDGGAAVMPDSTSIVNVLRYVFGYYYGAELPPLPNTMYYSHWRQPYRFAEISSDFRVLGPLHGGADTAVVRADAAGR